MTKTLRLFRHGSILGVAWKPESLSLDMWALYPLCATGTDPQEWDDKSVTGSWLQ